MNKSAFTALHILLASMALTGTLICTANIYQWINEGTYFPKDLLWAIPLATAGGAGLTAGLRHAHRPSATTRNKAWRK